MPGAQPLVAGSEATEGGDVAGEDEGDHTGAPAAAPSVDELFARIRAGSESGAAAPEGDAEDTVAAAVAAVEAAGPGGRRGRHGGGERRSGHPADRGRSPSRSR